MAKGSGAAARGSALPGWKHPRGLNRWTIVHPAFCCMRDDCVRPSAGNHGRHGEEWMYVLQDGDCEYALSMVVYTNRHTDPTPPMHWPAEGARGAYLDLHALQPWYEGMEPRKECPYLGGRDCYSDGSLLYAEEFFKAHGDKRGPNQPEAFWRAMEAELRERLAGSFPEASKASAPSGAPKSVPERGGGASLKGK